MISLPFTSNVFLWLLIFGAVHFYFIRFAAQFFGCFWGVRRKLGKKLGTALYETLNYLVFSLSGFFILANPSGEHYLYGERMTQPMSPNLEWLYILQIARYLDLLIFLVFFDKHRKDFKLMLSHHVVTPTLMVLGVICRRHELGLFFMVLLDVADIFLHLAKFWKYLEEGQIRTQLTGGLANLTFAVFALVFFVTRCLMYPYWLFRGTWHSPDLQSIWLEGTTGNGPVDTTLVIINTSFLHLLTFMQVRWMIDILKVLKRALFDQVLEDCRSTEDSEEETDKKLD
jgi:ceramide synthetase